MLEKNTNIFEHFKALTIHITKSEYFLDIFLESTALNQDWMLNVEDEHSLESAYWHSLSFPANSPLGDMYGQGAWEKKDSFTDNIMDLKRTVHFIWKRDPGSVFWKCALWWERDASVASLKQIETKIFEGWD